MPRTMTIEVQDIVPEFVQLMKRGKKNLVLAHTERTLEKLSTMYQEVWRDTAAGMQSLPGLPFMIHGKQYQNTIKRRQISQTVWEVYSDYTTKSGRGVTDLLEAGHGNIDLKPGLLHGPKSRQGKNGRYNIVSFRQGAPGTGERNNPMPLSVYKPFFQEVKRIDAAKKAGAAPIGTPGGTSYSSKSGTQPGGSKGYSWGSRYNPGSLKHRQVKNITRKGKKVGQYKWKSGKYASMVRLQQSTTKSNRGGYFTFRVVSSQSDPMSWIVPEQEPWPIRTAVINFMRPFAEGMLREALEADIR